MQPSYGETTLAGEGAALLVVTWSPSGFLSAETWQHTPLALAWPRV